MEKTLMFKFEIHINNLLDLPIFQSVHLGGFGKKFCISCRRSNYYDIFTYDNIIQKDSRLHNKCPYCGKVD